jgi:hypothetical protein
MFRAGAALRRRSSCPERSSRRCSQSKIYRLAADHVKYSRVVTLFTPYPQQELLRGQVAERLMMVDGVVGSLSLAQPPFERFLWSHQSNFVPELLSTRDQLIQKSGDATFAPLQSLDSV